MSERALSFGAVAAAYERYRPGYPDELVDVVVDFAGREVRTALEIGAGTGKATRAFAARGIAVTASEPDTAMLEELRRHVPDSVVTVPAPFEELTLSSRFDLVFAAASLHWTEPSGRWARVSGLLVESGTFASFGGPMDLADPDVEAAVRAARSPFLADDDVPSPDGTAPEAELQWPGTELEATPAFTDVRQTHLPRRLTLDADDYVAHLATISAYLTLPPAVRAQALDAVRAVLPAQVELVADLTVHLARRA